MSAESSTRGNASEFFVAGELCRRGLIALVTVGNTPNTDILCSNLAGTKFVHIQVKTFKPGNSTCSVGKKAERYYGDNFFWVLAGIPTPESERGFEYYIIPSKEMSLHVAENHRTWLDTPGIHGQPHNDNSVRAVHLPPRVDPLTNWDISEHLNRWDIIEDKLIE